MAKRIYILFLLFLPVCGGCTSSAQRYFMYLFWPGGRTKTVEAAFPDLAGHSVAVVIYAGENVEFEHPYARLTLSKRIAAELKQRVRKVNVIDPAIVLRYQDENLNWDSMSKVELGKTFKADYILMVSLLEYTTREPNSISLSRGHIAAEADVYQTSLPEEAARVRHFTGISAVFPEGAPVGAVSTEAARMLDETERRFVDALVKKFYKHDEEIKL